MKKSMRRKTHNKKQRKQSKEKVQKIMVKVERTPMENYALYALLLFMLFLLAIIVYMLAHGESSATGAVVGFAEQETVEVQQERYVSERELEILLNKSREIVEEMQEAGLGTLYVNDLLIEMQDEINDVHVNYNKIVENAGLIRQAKEDAFYVRDLLVLKQEDIQEYEKISGFDAGAAWTLYNKAEEEFVNERYGNARSLLGEITATLDRITVDQTRLQTRILAQTNRFWEWIKENIIGITITIIILAIIVALTYKRIQYTFLRRRIHHLMIEQDVISTLMKKAQKEYYAEKKITKSMYAMKMEMYMTRVEEIKALLPVLRKELEKKKRERVEAITEKGGEEKEIISAKNIPKIEMQAVIEKKEEKKKVHNTAKRKEQKSVPKKQEKNDDALKEQNQTIADLEKEFGEERRTEEKKTTEKDDTKKAEKKDIEGKQKEERNKKQDKGHKPLTEFFEW